MFFVLKKNKRVLGRLNITSKRQAKAEFEEQLFKILFLNIANKNNNLRIINVVLFCSKQMYIEICLSRLVGSAGKKFGNIPRTSLNLLFDCLVNMPWGFVFAFRIPS